MPIEFQCLNCQKRLRVPDTSIGKKARCPDCGTIQEVPSEDSGEKGEFGGFASAETGEQIPALPYSELAETSNPFAAPKPSDNPYASPAISAPSPVMYGASDRERAARAKVEGPAIALTVVAALSIAAVVINTAVNVIPAANNGNAADIIGGVFGLGLGLAINALIIVGAQRMKRLENYGLAITASVLAMICSCGCLSLPIGIWSLVVLCDSNVKSAFHS